MTFKVLRDIAYSSNYPADCLLDLFLPYEERRNGACLLLIHGGGFKSGNKESFHEVAGYFADSGYVCATPNYRKFPYYRFPAWIEDARLALQFVSEKSKSYGFSENKIVTMGSSAGAYLALLLGLLPPNKTLWATEELRLDYRKVCAVIAYCPVLDLRLEILEATKSENNKNLEKAAICALLGFEKPPMLFIHGTNDQLVPFSLSEIVCKQINDSDGHAELVSLPEIGHGFGYGVQSEVQKKVLKHVVKFLNRVLWQFDFES